MSIIYKNQYLNYIQKNIQPINRKQAYLKRKMQLTDQKTNCLQAQQKNEPMGIKTLKSERIISISKTNEKQVIENTMNIEQARTEISLNSRNSIIEEKEQKKVENQIVNAGNMIYKQNFNHQQYINQQVHFKNKLQYWLNQCQIIKFDQMSQRKYIQPAPPCHSLDFAILMKFNLQLIKTCPLQQKSARTEFLIDFMKEQPSYNPKDNKKLVFPKYLCDGCQLKLINMKKEFNILLAHCLGIFDKSSIDFALEFIKQMEPFCQSFCKILYVQSYCLRSDEEAVKKLLTEKCLKANYMETSHIKSKFLKRQFNYIKEKELYQLLKFDLKENSRKHQYRNIIFHYRYCYQSQEESQQLKKKQPQSRDYNVWAKYKDTYCQLIQKQQGDLNQVEISKRIQAYKIKQPSLTIKRLERTISELKKQHKDDMEYQQQRYDKKLKEILDKNKEHIESLEKRHKAAIQNMERNHKKIVDKLQKQIEELQAKNDLLNEKVQALMNKVNQFAEAQKQKQKKNQDEKPIEGQQTEFNLTPIKKQATTKKKEQGLGQMKEKDIGCCDKLAKWISSWCQKEPEVKKAQVLKQKL